MCNVEQPFKAQGSRVCTGSTTDMSPPCNLFLRHDAQLSSLCLWNFAWISHGHYWKKMYYIKDRESRCWGPASSPSRTWVPVIFPCIFYCCCHIAVSLGKSPTCIKALGICEKCSVFDPHLGFKCCNLCIAKQIKKVLLLTNIVPAAVTFKLEIVSCSVYRICSCCPLFTQAPCFLVSSVICYCLYVWPAILLPCMRMFWLFLCLFLQEYLLSVYYALNRILIIGQWTGQEQFLWSSGGENKINII